MPAKNIVIGCVLVLGLVTLYAFMSGVLGHFPFGGELDPPVVKYYLIKIGGILLAISFLFVGAFWRIEKSYDISTRKLKNARAVLEHVCTQENADAMLGHLAAEFHNAAEAEGKIVAALARDDETQTGHAIVQDVTQYTKKQFWNAHGVVKALPGVEVRGSYKDYLPDSSGAE